MTEIIEHYQKLRSERTSYPWNQKSGYQCLQYREWIKDIMPNGRDGFTTEDVDLMLRYWGPNFKQDAIGRVALVEVKKMGQKLGYSKELMFGFLDHAIRTSALSNRYIGFYLVQWELDLDWAIEQRFIVNGVEMNNVDLQYWISRPDSVKPLEFDGFHIKLNQIKRG